MIAAIAYIALLCLLAIITTNNLWLAILGLKSVKRPSQKLQQDDAKLPTVAVQLPVFNEELVVRDLINCIGQLDYPTGKFEIQILDDSNNGTPQIVKNAITEQRLLNPKVKWTHIRRDDRNEYKAGALRNALRKTNAEFVAIFDADFRPEPDFLKRLIPYFQDSGIGFVQASWCKYSNDFHWSHKVMKSFITFVHLMAAGAAQKGYYTNFKGTAGILRKKAILDSGNWQGDTFAEDIDLSYRMYQRGYRAKYVHDYAVRNELPMRLSDFFDQQARWVIGSAQAGLKLIRKLFSSTLSPAKRIQAAIRCFGPVVQCIACCLIGLFAYPVFSNVGWETLYAKLSIFLVSVGYLAYLIDGYVLNKITSDDNFIRITLGRFLLSSGIIFVSCVELVHLLFRKRSWDRTPKFGNSNKPPTYFSQKTPPIIYSVVGLIVSFYILFLYVNTNPTGFCFWFFFCQKLVSSTAMGISEGIRWMQILNPSMIQTPHANLRTS